jgi:hypothetical protein
MSAQASTLNQIVSQFKLKAGGASLGYALPDGDGKY